TNYFVGRLSREMREGRSAAGAIVTSVNRSLDPSLAPILRSNAYTAGLDYSHEFADREWFVGAYAVGSYVEGSPESILAVQRSSARYYRRPDSRHLELDPGATSLTGAAAAVQVRKQSGEHWTGDAQISTISPGLEINDMGFQQR